MRLTLVTNIISPHQLPLARQIVAHLGANAFRYVATEPVQAERAQLGWVEGAPLPWVLEPWRGGEAARAADIWLHEADVVLCGTRDLDLFAQRLAGQKLLLYMAERWFKPPQGVARLLHPGFLRMALRFRSLAQSPGFHYLPIGYPAAQDMRTICRLPGRNWLWGYFVDPPANFNSHAGQNHSGSGSLSVSKSKNPLRILWVGRMLKWKRVDTLIRAVALCRARNGNCGLRLVGSGEQERKLRHLAQQLGCQDKVIFDPPVPIAQVRAALQQADVYVLPSNGCEGWGVALNEAMLEGCCVVASQDAGSAATLIRQRENGLLFRPGDVSGLAEQLLQLERDELLRQQLAAAGRETMLSAWTPEIAANRLLAFSEALLAGRTPPVHASGPLQAV